MILIKQSDRYWKLIERGPYLSLFRKNTHPTLIFENNFLNYCERLALLFSAINASSSIRSLS